jgi:hypothetical protein
MEIEMAFDSTMITHYAEMVEHYRESVNRNKNLYYMADLVEGYRIELKDYESKLDSTNNHLITTLKKRKSIKDTDQDTLVAHTYQVYYMAQNSFGAMLKGYAFMTSQNNLKPYPNGDVFYVRVDKE